MRCRSACLALVILALAACRGSVASSSHEPGDVSADAPCDTGAGVTTLVPPSGSFAYSLFVDDDFVWFAAMDGVRKVPRTGGAEVLVASSGSESTALALVGSAAYFFGSYEFGEGPKPQTAMALFAAPRQGGTPSVVVDGAWARMLVTDGTSIFWPKGQGIARLDPPGTTPVDLAPGARIFPEGIAVDDAYVYVSNFPLGPNGTIERIPKSGGASQTIVSNQAHPAAIVVDDAAIYWIDDGYGSGTNAIALMRAAKDGSNAAALVRSPGPDLSNAPIDVAVDASNVYWLDYGGRVMKMPKSGGAQTEIASGLESPDHILVHGGNVYWENDTTGAMSVGEPNHAVMTACK